MFKKERKVIDITQRLRTRGKEDTQGNVEEELERLKEEGYEIKQSRKVKRRGIAWVE